MTVDQDVERAFARELRNEGMGPAESIRVARNLMAVIEQQDAQVVARSHVDALDGVAHAAWELYECSWMAPRSITLSHLECDHGTLGFALDELRATGWEGHEIWGDGQQVPMTDHHPSATSEFAWDLIDSIVGIEGTEGPVDVMAHTSTWFGKGPVDAMNAELAARGLESRVVGQTSGPTTFTRRRPTETCPTCGSAVPKYCMTFIDNHWGRCPDAWHTDTEVL